MDYNRLAELCLPGIDKTPDYWEKHISLRNYQTEFIPEIEHISQQINGRSLMFYTVEKVHQASLLCAAMFNGAGPQMRIGKEINVLHRL